MPFAQVLESQRACSGPCQTPPSAHFTFISSFLASFPNQVGLEKSFNLPLMAKVCQESES
jgi:hypothetical protein